MDEIILDKNGYEQYLNEIENLKNEKNIIASKSSQAYSAAVGDGWHDNFEFEQTMREDRIMSKRLQDLLSKGKNIKIIEEKSKNKNLINIGDKLKIKVIYSEDDYEIFDIILTGNFIPIVEEEITLNSPIGKSIYHKKKNEEIKGIINGNKIKIIVIEELN